MYQSAPTPAKHHSGISELNIFQLNNIRGGVESGNQIPIVSNDNDLDLTKPPVVIDPVTGKPVVPKK